MGSSLVGSIVEKFGYLNIPVRKIGLHDYLMGIRDLQDGFMKHRLHEILADHNNMIHSGGVNVQDRDNSLPRVLADPRKVVNELKYIDDHLFPNTTELYDQIKQTYAKALVYKKSKHEQGKHIEYTTNITSYPARQLNDAYAAAFDDVYMVNLHRDFLSWIESLISQRFAHPHYRSRCLFTFHAAVSQYKTYEKTVKDYPGLHLDFESLFCPNNKDLLSNISELINQPVPSIHWEKEDYDMYGRLADYNKSFTKADIQGSHLSTMTRRIIRGFMGSKKITLFQDIVVQVLYLFELVRFKLFTRNRNLYKKS